MKKIDRQIQEQAAMQYGLVTRSQLLEHGKRGQITRRLESGLLVRVRQSVYRAPSLPVTWRQELLSACFAGGRLSAASFRAAAQITFLPGGQEIVEISCRRHRRAQYDDVIVHETRFLEDRDIIVVDGIPVTRAARTICDLACLVELGELDEATLAVGLGGRVLGQRCDSHCSKRSAGILSTYRSCGRNTSAWAARFGWAAPPC
jgi:hypothetical protein